MSIVDYAINDLYMRINCLLADFSFIAIRFHVYLTPTAKNIYGSPLWKHFVRKVLEPFYIAWRKSVVWKIPRTTHNVFMPYIHNSNAFDVILEIHYRVCA